MSNEFESTESDVTNEQVSSEPDASTQQGEHQGNTQETEQAEKQAPFHEHPRFKEVISQNNQYKTQLTQYESALKEMQSRLQQLETGPKQQAVKPEAELFERLKKIDPSFGNKFEEVASTAEQIREMKEWREQMETQRVREQYSNGLEKLCSEYKVTPAWKNVYDAELRSAAMQNPNLSINDLPRVFKEVHEKFEAIRREERAQYVTDKSKDAKTPSTQSKGKVPSSNAKKEAMPLDREEALGSIVQQALKSHRANNDF